MKPCHKQNHPNRTASSRRDTPSTGAASQATVHRYVHPIRSVRPAVRSQTEELLAGVLEALSRQSEQLEEVLRRLNREG